MNAEDRRPLQVIALGQFSADLPPLAARLRDIQVAPRRCLGIDQLDAALTAQHILLCDINWLNVLTPDQRTQLAASTKRAACWIVLNDVDTRFKDLVVWQRLGVTQFFQKPLDAERLANLIEDLHDRANGPPIRAIFLDDEHSALSYYGEVLERAGIRCFATQDPLLVLESLADHRPDVLILDIEMPGCRGPELVSIIRQRPEFQRLPVIYLTAMQGQRDKLLARETAAEDFLGKPVDSNLLVAAVESQARRFRSLERSAANARAALSRSQAFLDRLRQAMDQHDIVSIADVAGNITYVNDKFCAISGFGREELLGQNHRLVKSGEHAPAFYRELWANITSGNVWHGELCNRAKAGGRYWVSATIVPFLDERGKPYQYVSIRTDITANKTNESRLLESQAVIAEKSRLLAMSEERLSFAIDGAGDGIWDWDLPSGRMSLSGNYEHMLGYAKGEIPPNIDAWAGSVHAEDLPRVQALLKDYLAGAIERYEVELRLRCKDGRYKWVLCRGAVAVRDEAKRPLRMVGIHSDISARKLAERQVDYLKEAIETISEGFAIYDAEDRFVLANSRYRELYGLAAESLVVGRPFQDIVGETVGKGLYPEAVGHEGLWLQGRVEQHRVPGKPFEQRLADGRWLRVAEYRMADGSIAGLRSDITDLKRAEEALIEAKEVAERANQAKSDFLSSMSHELRTPMNVILGFAQLLEQDEMLNDEQRDSLQEIRKAGRHLLELINEVLDLAKIESGRINLSMESFALTPLFEECRAMIAPLTTTPRLSLAMHAPPGLSVFADRARLKQVLLNLLSNAVKYNRPEGAIEMTAVSMADGRIRLSVRDSGKGVAAERLAELFQPFNRLDAESSQIEGTGIGLSISKRLTEMMGGEIGVDSALGAGSTFWLTLNPGQLDKLGAGEAAPALVETALAAASARADILCIDDNPANLKLFSQILGRQPYIHLRTAHAPEQGIELALMRCPDLILLDINMPGLSGYDVLEILHADARLRCVPVIAVTANAMPSDIERGKAAGFVDYITKPIVVEPFLATIQRHLANRRERAKAADA